MSAINQNDIVQALAESNTYKEYEKAFTDATGMPMAFRSVDSWKLPLRGKTNESPFCALMSQQSRTCATCMQIQEALLHGTPIEPRTLECPTGLADTIVPVKNGDKVIGYLQTGQIHRGKPSMEKLENATRLFQERGLDVNMKEMKRAYFSTRRMTPEQHDAAIKLLTLFAQHLSMISNQILVRQQNAEPPVITRAKSFIEEHQGEKLSLERVAKAVNTSTFYFCKIFKKVTGLNFVDYLSRVRIEKAKKLLLNPNLRISEIAFEVGFQSLTHFNRVFKKIGGQSPTEYRSQVLGN